jgi:hypothetical protein
VPVTMACARPARAEIAFAGRPRSELISGREAAQRCTHQAGGTMLDPGCLVARGLVRLALLTRRLDAHQQRAGAARLVHHSGGLGAAFLASRMSASCLVGQLQVVLRLGAGGGDELGGDFGLGAIGGQRGCDVGDRSVCRGGFRLLWSW